MTPLCFVYWLQGFFELSFSQQETWNHEATRKIVKNHVELVYKTLPENQDRNTPILVFIQWLWLGLDYHVASFLVKDRLAELFEHVIDPEFDAVYGKENLQAIHDLDLGYEQGMRC